jgi:hypothetical protein
MMSVKGNYDSRHRCKATMVLALFCKVFKLKILNHWSIHKIVVWPLLKAFNCKILYYFQLFLKNEFVYSGLKTKTTIFQTTT